MSIAQPRWEALADASDAAGVVERLGGFPVLVRPSYVLSGAAMSVAHEHHQFEAILGRAKRISPDHPVVVSKFETHAREIEIDAVADAGQIVLWAISEHVENAGVHSGDATLVLPPQSLYLPTIRRAREIAGELARALEITGPFNVQFVAKNNEVKVIECNLRASRSFPFVSKVLGVNFAGEAMRRMLGCGTDASVNVLELDYVGVKVPMFSFGRLHGADPLLGVEMASTGEVGCIAGDMHEALLLGLISTGLPRSAARRAAVAGAQGREVRLCGRSADHPGRIATADIRDCWNGRYVARDGRRLPGRRQERGTVWTAPFARSRRATSTSSSIFRSRTTKRDVRTASGSGGQPLTTACRC